MKDDPLASLVPELQAPAMAAAKAQQQQRSGAGAGVSSSGGSAPARPMAAPPRPSPASTPYTHLGFSPSPRGGRTDDAFAVLAGRAGGGDGKGR